MNPFILGAHDRLEHWKTFRKSLSALPEREQLKSVAHYWALAPLIARPRLDIEDLSTFPTPWEMVSAGDWCRSSIAVGMEFTLRLSGWDKSRMELRYIRDYDISDQIMILIIDQDTVLNYDYDEVTSYPNTKHDVIARWEFSGKLYTPVSRVNTRPDVQERK